MPRKLKAEWEAELNMARQNISRLVQELTRLKEAHDTTVKANVQLNLELARLKGVK